MASRVDTAATSPLGFNRSARHVLRLVRAHGQLDRARIARITGLTRPAVTEITSTLIDQGVLEDTGETRRAERGRPAGLIQVSGQRFYCLGIAVEHHVEVAVTALNGTVCRFIRFPNPLLEAADEMEPVGPMADRVEALVAPLLVGGGVLVGAGVSTGGDVDERQQAFLRATAFRSAEQANALVGELRERFHVPVVVEHEARAALLAERWMDPDLPPMPSLLYVMDNLGFALMLEGRIYRGPARWGRYLGRIQLHAGTPDLTLALTANTRNISQRLHGQPATNEAAVKVPGQRGRLLRDVYRAYRRRDPHAVELIHQSFDDLGHVICNIGILFALDRVILQGWSRPVLRDGIPRVEEALSQGRFSEAPPPPVRPASLGIRQQAVGTALRALDWILEESEVERSA